MRGPKRTIVQKPSVLSDYEVSEIFQRHQAERGTMIDWGKMFIEHPSFTDMDFRQWAAMECSKEKYKDVDDAVLHVGEMLGRCYCSSSTMRVLRMMRNSIPAPQMIPAGNDFMTTIVSFDVDDMKYSVRLETFARIIVVKEITASPAYNVLVTAPPKNVDLATPVGMQLGYEPIVDNAARRAFLESEARRLHVPCGFWNKQAALLRPEDGDPIFTTTPRIIPVFREYVTEVLAGGDLEDALHLMLCFATIVRGERLRMFLYLMTRATQVGKTTVKNFLYKIGVTTATIENAEVLTGEFNAHVKEMLVCAEELTRNPKNVPRIMATLRSIATAMTMWVYRKGVDGREEEVVGNVCIMTNGQQSEDGATPAVHVDFGDERMLLFKTTATTNPNLFAEFYDLLNDPKQLRALFVYLSGLHEGTVYSDTEVARHPHKFNPCARPADMRARLAAYAYVSAPPLTRLVANVFTGGAFDMVPPGVFVEGLLRHSGIVSYLLYTGIKTPDYADKLIGTALTDGLLSRVSAGAYEFGPQCVRMFALAAGMSTAPNIEPVRAIVQMSALQRAERNLFLIEGAYSRSQLITALLESGAVETENDARRMIQAALRANVLLNAPFYIPNTVV